MQIIPRIVISPGEPAGIGPDIIIQAAQSRWPAELVIVGDSSLFSDRAKQLNLPLELIPFDKDKKSTLHQPSQLKIINIPLASPCKTGLLDKKNAPYVLECLEKATELCLKKKATALVTGPIQKSILNDAGFQFKGHTEFLAHYCNVKQALMLFVTPQMKVALATTHVPVSKISGMITPELLKNTLRMLHKGLIEFFNYKNPRILVCGLNPHAGESGHLGSEEIDVILPTLNELRSENMNVEGPFSADTIFTKKYLERSDAILAMYHDQALPVVKYSGFEQAINVTLGLPIIRTSVDHGTALDLAGSGLADAGSLIAAIKLAIPPLPNPPPQQKTLGGRGNSSKNPFSPNV